MSALRIRQTVESIISWINEGFIRINNPETRDPYAALKSDKVRMSTIASVCLRNAHYGERYPELQMPDITDEKSMKSVYRMVMGTLIHEGEYLKHKGEIKELFLEYDNVTGHCDIYLPKYGILLDIKTTRWIGNDPHPHHVLQLEGYYAMLNMMGHPCYQLFLFYVDTCGPSIKLFEIVEAPPPNQPIEDFVTDENVSRQVVIRNRTIEEIWDEVSGIRDVMLLARKEGKLPAPINPNPQRKEHWLCEKYCSFRKRCIMNSL